MSIHQHPTAAQWHPESLPPYIERTHDLDMFEGNGRRAVVSFSHSHLPNRLHWKVRTWGYRDGCIHEGCASSYASPHAARDAAREFVSDMAAFRAGRGA